ncbi:MAG: MFS transporter [Acidobacteria bacterium]|nr:MAG: MFS transporter [Acidobacteriota bacterium]REK03761.1 MAG: MFS transporter [Acidobacteriota bacterium]
MTTGPLSDRERSYTLLLLVLVFTSSHVDRQIVAILAQPIKEAFALSDLQLGLLTGFAFALFYATLGMPMAIWADRGNRRNLIALAIALWSGMTVLCGLAQSYWQLLAARIGVGVGEAGSNPPSHSIIADLYPPEKRGTAMAIFAVGVNLGIMLGYLIGGWGNEWLDWRWAFVLAGAPGLLIALLVRLTIREPPRVVEQPVAPADADAARAKGGGTVSFWSVAATLWRSGILRHTVIAGTVVSFAGYATIAWIPTYFVRVHGQSTGEAGTVLALYLGIGGGIGTFLGGWVADRVAPFGEGWRAWVVTLSLLAYTPLAVLCYTAESARVASLAFLGPAVLGGVYIGVGFAIIQSQVSARMRAQAAAINLFILNIVGLGLGPTTVGAISDWMQPTRGTDSLRYGLLAMVAAIVWGAAHYFRAGQLLQRQTREMEVSATRVV